ncbi:MAG: hypothetical protein Q8N13_10575 [Acidovorax sp.]|nr:hypothetical protein [Acidovorax sp.]
MAFTYRNIKGSELSYAELDENFGRVETLHDATQDALALAEAAAALAVAAENFKGEWSGLTGGLEVPASASNGADFYMLLVDLADVTIEQPGVSAAWKLIPLGGLTTDFATLPDSAALDGTEILAVDQTTVKRSTIQKVLDWILARANSWTGLQTFKELRETMVTANTGSAYTINLANGSMFDLTLTGNCAYTFPTASSGKQFTILQKQDGTGSRAVTWPSSVRWAVGAAPTITATAGLTDVISFVADGTYWIGFVGGQNYNRS